VLFSKQVASFGNLWRFLRKAARGEASRRTFRKKLLPSGTSGASFGKRVLRGTRFGKRTCLRKLERKRERVDSNGRTLFLGKDGLISESTTRLEEHAVSELTYGLEAVFPSFFQKAARGEASRRMGTSSLPSGSFTSGGGRASSRKKGRSFTSGASFGKRVRPLESTHSLFLKEAR